MILQVALQGGEEKRNGKEYMWKFEMKFGQTVGYDIGIAEVVVGSNPNTRSNLVIMVSYGINSSVFLVVVGQDR